MPAVTRHPAIFSPRALNTGVSRGERPAGPFDGWGGAAGGRKELGLISIRPSSFDGFPRAGRRGNGNDLETSAGEVEVYRIQFYKYY